MTLREYEQLYAEAVVVVRNKIRGVGQPETTPSGRILRIGPILCDDEVVFILAWGKERTRVILNQEPRK